MSETVVARSNEKLDFSNPPEECDLVMKGGVTSGIIYPPAIRKLATQYRFRNIGGTSAGAIAAAATAAAEYRRTRGQANEAFEVLEDINHQLGSCLVPDPKDDKECQVTFLQNLFQPSEKTKPLFDIGLALVTKKPKSSLEEHPTLLSRLSWLNATLKAGTSAEFTQGSQLGFFFAFLVAFLLAGISFFVFYLFDQETNPAGFLVLLVLYGFPLSAITRPVGGWIASLQEIWEILKEITINNGFGLCTGKAGIPSAGSGKALIEWLHEDVINKLADKPLNQPLTFGDLKKPLENTNPEDAIILNMVTSNLSHNRPYLLPFQENIFIFKEEEFLKLFPKEVVDYLVESAPPPSIPFDDDRYHLLPIGDAMPVLVATRMSLSFPILFSAIPLYTVPASVPASKQELTVIKTKELQRNWFSDGGISSNFPIHFFDAWIPGRPTFGINLTTWQEQDSNKSGKLGDAPPMTQFSCMLSQTPSELPSEDRLTLPKADKPAFPLWKNLDNDLSGFLGAIFATSQNYRDTMQSMLPSYRERIVQIRLKDNEGGLNLNMPADIIKFLKTQGESAGSTLLKEFNFDCHQWVRIKVMMGLLEAQLKTIAIIIKNSKFDYEKLLEKQKGISPEFPYPESNEDWIKDALGRLKELLVLIENWQNYDSTLTDPQSSQRNSSQKGFAQRPPLDKENPILRVTPDL